MILSAKQNICWDVKSICYFDWIMKIRPKNECAIFIFIHLDKVQLQEIKDATAGGAHMEMKDFNHKKP